MVDIRGYPNPLAEELAGRLGLHFESVNGKPIWRDGAPTVDQISEFMAEKLTDPTNLHRLLTGGGTREPTVKVFYDGQAADGVFIPGAAPTTETP